MTQEDATFCAARWRALCGRLGAGEQASAAWWARVSAAYSGDGRFYHTLRHIGQMLQLKDANAASLADGDAVELAIFFHDVVYDAAGGGGGKNERDSALVLLEFCESALGGGYAAAQRVARWIEMTAHHRCDAETEADWRFLMDFDMAILAAPPAEYSAYSRAVRREYSHVSTVAWCVGRGRFLSQAAAAGTAVFATPAFAALEERARSNARSEAAALRRRLLALSAAALAAASVVGLALLLPASPPRTFDRAATAAAAAVAAAAAATRFEPFPQRDGAARDARPACIAGSFNPPHNGRAASQWSSPAARPPSHRAVAAVQAPRPRAPPQLAPLGGGGGDRPQRGESVRRLSARAAGSRASGLRRAADRERARRVLGRLHLARRTQARRASPLPRHPQLGKGRPRGALARVSQPHRRTPPAPIAGRQTPPSQRPPPRPSPGPPALALAPPLRTCFLEADPRYAHVSSTLIRRRCAAAESVADLVPPSIADAVVKLYG